jgi:hypothetical protein
MATEPTAMPNPCEHAWECNKPAHASASVRVCSLCRTIDGEDLMRTLNEYAVAFRQKPATLVYAWSDEQTLSVVDQPGGIPDSGRERALLRGLLQYTLAQLDQYEITGPLGVVSQELA